MKSSSSEGPVEQHFGLADALLLALLFAIAAFATDMYQPALPAIRQTFATGAEQVQLSLSLFLYGNALGHLVFGPLSDRFGRKPVLLLGLVAYVLATLGCALAASIDSFLLYRALQGGAAASGPVLVRALINDRLTREEAARMLALLTGMMALAAMSTPIAGGWLVEHYHWRAIFFSIAALATVLLLTASVKTRETLAPHLRLKALGVRELLRGYVEIVLTPAFWAFVLPPALMFSGVFAYVSVNSFLLIEQLGISAQLQGVCFSIAASAYVTGSFTSNRLVARLGIERAIVFGLVLGVSTASGALIASLTLPLSLALVVAPAVCLFFSTALLVPIALSAAVSLFPARGGTASAVAGFTQLTFAGLSAGLAAWLVTSNTVPLHGFTLLVCIAAGAAWFGGQQLRRKVWHSSSAAE